MRRADDVMLGVDSVRQLSEILQAADGPPPQDDPEFATADADLINPARW